jgi:HD superfamily phosphodiesterase
MNRTELIREMIAYDAGDAKRIQHFLKVHTLAALIGKEEKLSEETQNILEAAAILHDIGIHEAERKYGSTSGKYQEQEGAPLAKAMLEKLGYEGNFV